MGNTLKMLREGSPAQGWSLGLGGRGSAVSLLEDRPVPVVLSGPEIAISEPDRQSPLQKPLADRKGRSMVQRK